MDFAWYQKKQSNCSFNLLDMNGKVFTDTELQIKGDIGDNLKIIFLVSQQKHML